MSQLEEGYRAYLALCNERKFDRLGDFVQDPLQLNGQTFALSDFATRLSKLVETVPDFRWEMIDFVAGNDKLAVRNRTTGTPRAEWLGVIPNGNSVVITELVFYTYRNGKIAEIWFLFDLASVRSQLA